MRNIYAIDNIHIYAAFHLFYDVHSTLIKKEYAKDTKNKHIRHIRIMFRVVFFRPFWLIRQSGSALRFN